MLLTFYRPETVLISTQSDGEVLVFHLGEGVVDAFKIHDGEIERLE